MCRLFINILCLQKLCTEKSLFHLISQIFGLRQLNQQVGFIGIRDFLVFKIKVDAGLPAGCGSVVVHGFGLLSGNAFLFRKEIKWITFGLGFQIWIQLEAMPFYRDAGSIGKLRQGFFKFLFTYITERTAYVTPDIYFHDIVVINNYKFTVIQ